MKKDLLLLAMMMTLGVSCFAKSINDTQLSVEFYSDTTVTDTLKLRDRAASFDPKQLNLTNSLLENSTLNKFLAKADKQAIRSSADYDYFITMIVLKQYELHITKFHQGFDLFSMRAGNAGFIVQSFVELSKQPQGTKGLNSAYVLEYIASNENLKNDTAISEVVNRITALQK